jgi:hypothetical protein
LPLLTPPYGQVKRGKGAPYGVSPNSDTEMAARSTFEIELSEHMVMSLTFSLRANKLQEIELILDQHYEDGDAERKAGGLLSLKEIKNLRDYLNAFLEVADRDYSDNMM